MKTIESRTNEDFTKMPEARDRGLTPKYASTGLIPGREATVVDRIGGTLQVAPHGSLTAIELDDCYGNTDANIEYIEVVRTRPNGTERHLFLITPEAAIALGERMVELGREALQVRQQRAEA